MEKVQRLRIVAIKENAMRLMIAAIIGISVLAHVGTASALERVQHSCPKEYALLGKICISATTGDIVLPIKKMTSAHPQLKAER